MKRALSGFNLNTVVMLMVSGALCYMQKQVLDAVYRLPAIEQQLLQYHEELDGLKIRVQAWEEWRAHHP